MTVARAKLRNRPKVEPVIAIITGGRDFAPDSRTRASAVAALDGVVAVFEGCCATGFDPYLAGLARSLRIPIHSVPALWGLQGNSAGPRRNARMVRWGQLLSEELRLRVVLIQGPGRKGTRNMVGLCREAGFEVRQVAGLLARRHNAQNRRLE